MAIELLCTDSETPQYQHALELKLQFEDWLKERKEKDDKIFIAPNFRIYGEKVRDIDVLIFGLLSNGASMRLDFFDEDNQLKTNKVYIGSFCFAIDIREEDSENISIINEEIWIDVNGRNANFSEYNKAIYNSLRKFMSHYFTDDKNIPFITTCLNFRNIPSNKVSSTFPNFIRGNLTVEKLFQSYAYISRPHQGSSAKGSFYSLDSIFETKEKKTFDTLKSVVSAFSLIKSGIGPLTKIKLDALSKGRKDLPQYLDSIGKELLIFKGGAGTGKTLKILNIANDLYASGKRCLILTYNRALVADISRLLDLHNIKSEPLTETIAIKTIHSFFNPILDEIIHWKDIFFIDEQQEFLKTRSLDSSYCMLKDDLQKINSKSNIYYLTCYDQILKSAAEKIADFQIPDFGDVCSPCQQALSNFDYILIDEAQDWKKEERDILYSLFGSHKIMIADGLQQLIRTQSPLNWKISNNNPVKYNEIVFPKKSLRQNEKLCLLQSYFAKKYSVSWNVAINESLKKGTIYVYVGEMNDQIAGSIKEFTKSYSIDKYDDLLFLAPPNMIEKHKIQTKFRNGETTLAVDEVHKRSFKYKEAWLHLGLKIFDMTYIESTKKNQPAEGEYRLINYESCRGLESYGVVALEMDTFFDNKIKFYNEDEETIKQGDIFTQSHESKALRYAALWSLLVFSRPVELLVITIKDANSIFFKTLKEISQNTENIIQIIE